MRGEGWVGFDLDGTLAIYECDWSHDYNNIGAPIAPMIELVKHYLAEGIECRIVTARADCDWKGKTLTYEEMSAPIRAWCKEHIGQELPVTNKKDYNMLLLYDDRAIHVEKNTGRILG